MSLSRDLPKSVEISGPESLHEDVVTAKGTATARQATVQSIDFEIYVEEYALQTLQGLKLAGMRARLVLSAARRTLCRPACTGTGAWGVAVTAI